MSVSCHSSFKAAALFVLTATLLSACSNAAVSKAVGTAGDAGAPLVVETSASSVTVSNHAGRPLLDVRITIEVAEAPASYLGIVPTLDTGATGSMALADFRSEEATLLDPASVHPRQVRVTARDTLAKTYEVTVPWKP